MGGKKGRENLRCHQEGLELEILIGWVWVRLDIFGRVICCGLELIPNLIRPKEIFSSFFIFYLFGRIHHLSIGSFAAHSTGLLGLTFDKK